jgi:PIN domain nuclease of toxin-antitoxin system
MILLDTHAWIWWLSDPEGSPLTPRERMLITDAHGQGAVAISAMSLIEAQMLVQKGRLLLTIPFEQWLREATRTDLVSVLPIDRDVVLAVHALPKSFHGDPADRVIYATSRLYDCQLITHDRRMRGRKS